MEQYETKKSLNLVKKDSTS